MKIFPLEGYPPFMIISSIRGNLLSVFLQAILDPLDLCPLQEDFEEFAAKAKTLPESTTNENKLILYGLFKQATVGPVNTCNYSSPFLFQNRL